MMSGSIAAPLTYDFCSVWNNKISKCIYYKYQGVLLVNIYYYSVLLYLFISIMIIQKPKKCPNLPSSLLSDVLLFPKNHGDLSVKYPGSNSKVSKITAYYKIFFSKVSKR